MTSQAPTLRIALANPSHLSHLLKKREENFVRFKMRREDKKDTANAETALALRAA
jgi:hypothetical protein